MEPNPLTQFGKTYALALARDYFHDRESTLNGLNTPTSGYLIAGFDK